MPIPAVQCLMACVHGQVLQRRLLARHHHVDVVPAAQAVIHHRQQGVGVRGQVHPDDVRLLVHHVVDEPRILVGEAVVVLPPDVRRQQVVQRRDGGPPADLARGLQPLGVLVEHRIDDVDEGLVGGEQAVAPGQQVALQPALAGVLGQDLHHPAVGIQALVGRQPLGHPGPRGGRQHVAQPVRGDLVRAEQAEVPGRLVLLRHRAQVFAQHPGGLGRAWSRGRRPPGRTGGSRAAADRASAPRRWRAGWRPSVGRPSGPGPAAPGAAGRDRRTAPRAGSCAARPPAGPGGPAAPPARPAAPGANARCPRPACHPPACGPVHPFGVRSTIIGQRGRSTRAAGAGLPLDVPDAPDDRVQGLGHRLVHGHRVVALDEERLVSVADHQRFQLGPADPGQHRGVGDLVAVEVQDGQHRPVVPGIEELVGVPGGGQRPGLGLPVAHHAGDQQIRVVEGGAVGV